MREIDWPLAIELAVMFVLITYARWRWFSSRARRWNRPRDERGEPPR